MLEPRYRDVSELSIDLRNRTLTFKTDGENPETYGPYRYAKSSPIGHLVDAMTKWSAAHAVEERGY